VSEPAASSTLPHGALAALRERLGAAARVNEPMANHTSLRVGGPADIFCVARGPVRLIETVEAAEALRVPWRVIGAGSNLLISDHGIDGLVVKAGSSARPIRVFRDGAGATVEADAGSILASLARQLVNEGLEGLEWAVNVPGTVGAAVVNNAGAFGSSTAERLVDADVHLPGAGRMRLTPHELEMSYRTTRLKRGELPAIVLDARFALRPADPASLRARTDATQRQRQATQPTGPSLGSMFANPPGDAAGRLIEAAGLKGIREGGAEISPLHANFMLNRGGAQASDVYRLISQAQAEVWRRFATWLVPEVQLVGRWRDEESRVLFTAPGDVATAMPYRGETLPSPAASF
jgi:UDP-N-acetylmuramate dehydrogenase